MNLAPVFSPHDSTVEWLDSTSAGTTLFTFTVIDSDTFVFTCNPTPVADAGLFLTTAVDASSK